MVIISQTEYNDKGSNLEFFNYVTRGGETPMSVYCIKYKYGLNVNFVVFQIQSQGYK